MSTEYALIEGKKWKTIVASKIFYTETSSNGFGPKIANESRYQVCELKYRTIMETDHIGSHIDQTLRIVDIFPAVQIGMSEISYKS